MTVVMNNDAKDVIVGSGKPAMKTWDIAGFTSMQVRTSFRAAIVKGTAFEVTTTADDNVLPQGKLKYELDSTSSLKYLGDPTILDGSKSGGSLISRGR